MHVQSFSNDVDALHSECILVNCNGFRLAARKKQNKKQEQNI